MRLRPDQRRPETGDLTGWIATGNGPGTWRTNDGRLDLFGPALPLQPIRGGFDATSEPQGPGVASLRQAFAVPATVVSATLAAIPGEDVATAA